MHSTELAKSEIILKQYKEITFNLGFCRKYAVAWRTSAACVELWYGFG